MARDDRDRAELAHRARVAQNDAVEQRPLDVRQRHARERLPAACAERQRGFLLVVALRLHQRDQFARDERKRHENRRQHDAGNGEDDLDVVCRQPRPKPALRAEEQHVDQAGDDRRDRERQIDQRDQQALSDEIELADRPGRAHAEDEIAAARRSAAASSVKLNRRDACPGRESSERTRRRPCRSASVKTIASGTRRRAQKEYGRHRSAAVAPTATRSRSPRAPPESR